MTKDIAEIESDAHDWVDGDEIELLAVLPVDDTQRKAIPVFDVAFTAFPDALVGVTIHMAENADRFSGGSGKVVWVRNLSDDHMNSLGRHMLDATKVPYDLRTARAIATRALMNLQLVEELHKGVEE